MNKLKLLYILVLTLFIQSAFAGNPPSVHPVRMAGPGGQFINHKARPYEMGTFGRDWSFVENKGQLAASTAWNAPTLKGTTAPTLKGVNRVALTLKTTTGVSDIKYYSHEGGANIYCQPGKISFVFTKQEAENNPNISEASGLPISDVGVQNFEHLHRKCQSTVTTNRLDLILLHSNPSAEITATDQQEYYENYYTTGDANNGITNVHTYKTITYKNIYPHIDMVLKASPSSAKATAGESMKYEFVIWPGGNPHDIHLQWTGTEKIERLKDLGIEYTFLRPDEPFGQAIGKMTETAPYSYTCAIGVDHGTHFSGQEPIPSHFILKNNHISFKIGKYDKTKVLVIDPTLVWATYFGGGEYDIGSAVATDNSGNVYITGGTNSTNRIATIGAFQTSYAGGTTLNGDAFLAKFNSAGACLWASYYGGAAVESGNGVAVDNLGNVYITGTTTSNNGIATIGAYQTFLDGIQNAFLAKFKSSGNLNWATYYGGGGTTALGPAKNYGYGVATDIYGYVYITGASNSNQGIATSGAYLTSVIELEDAFLAKFSGNGKIQWGTYYGGSENDAGLSVATDALGDVYITGVTVSPTAIATSGAYQTSYNSGAQQAFLAKFTNIGKLQWATYYGGPHDLLGYGVATDGSGNVYITGTTYPNSSGIATNGAYQTFFGGGGSDAFLVKFDGSGKIQWATYYGGSSNDEGTGIATDSLGNVYITGTTQSNSGIATAGAFRTSINAGATDAFLAIFNSSGQLQWATYYGGKNGFGYGVALDNLGSVYMTGSTFSSLDIATNGVYQISLGGLEDAFLAKFGSTSHNDAGILSILSPKDSFCPGTQTLNVKLKNYGINELDSVKLGWSVNNKIQKPFSWSGKLLNDSTVNVNLGNYNFKSGLDTIKAWTTKPNGQTDSFPGNDTAIIIVKVFDLPMATAGPDTTLCYNETYTMQGAGGITYLWTPAKYLSNDTIANPKAMLPNTQLYTLVVSNSHGCADSSQVLLTVRPRPVANFAILNTKPYKTDSAILFNNQSQNASKYLWTFDDNDSSKLLNPEHIYLNSGNYRIMLVAYGIGGCTNDTAYDNVKIINTDNIKIFIPNSFTPNLDGKNEVFDISGIGIKTYSYNIYNRWGEHIFQSSPAQTAWDGKFKGETVIEGVYLYIFDVTDVEGYHHYLNGTVTVLK